ncbi:Cmx/CmrA family chloramphenicol efflux MFS transporter [Streptomyces sp. IB2014 016-6]|uniref:Cmx/CmrA family chloramphenicol efflux MFS transporter n=1 Tax=Streptomyces sp. IB2014 016-6 TaxID=2517818 RepID=UPI0011C6F327|nr:Cmx/CmrA family chloramphenicol efflux MFS transporter [Streptomyces sp. IB2014 016-6]TXL86487.1 MFS transporter [Streptomyces sp. IB2014 016-6]
MPFAVYVLGLAVFAQGTSEFMLSGLVSGIAADLHVSIPDAGLLTSAFAVGMVIGAPLMALFSRKWPRRRALLIFLTAFVAAHVVGALTPSYEVLLATRIVGALANAGFWAVALAAAIAMVEPAARARATSVVVGGVTVACVVGVPAGALLGEHLGWRAAFWAVAVVSLPALVAIVTSVPDERPTASGGDTPEAAEASETTETPSVREELRSLTGRRVLLTLLTMALVQGATFCAFSYLEPLATRVTGLGAGWVPALLALFGVGSLVGVTLSGRIADARRSTLVVAGMASLALGWIALALSAVSPVATIALVFVQGMLAFGTGSAMITQVFQLASGAPTLAGSFATAAFNIGAAAGPWLGGLTIDAGFGFRSPVWVSVALMALALTTAAVTRLACPLPLTKATVMMKS